jgi:hypothetical protein
LWLIALVLVGVVLAVGTIGNPNRAMSVVLGVIVGAFATFVFTEWRHARQRVNALIGYARLLDAEIEANEPVVEALNKYRGRFLRDLLKVEYTPPTIEVWPEIRVKLAPLIEAEEFASINEYYRQLRVLVDLREGRPLAAAKGRPVDDLRSTLRSLTQEARRLLSKYANPPQRVRRLGFWV